MNKLYEEFVRDNYFRFSLRLVGPDVIFLRVVSVLSVVHQGRVLGLEGGGWPL